MAVYALESQTTTNGLENRNLGYAQMDLKKRKLEVEATEKYIHRRMRISISNLRAHFFSNAENTLNERSTSIPPNNIKAQLSLLVSHSL